MSEKARPTDDEREGSDKAPSPGDGAGGEGTGRRAFVALSVVGTCAIAATIGVPAAVFVAAPLGGKGGAGKKFAVAKLDDLTVGVPKKASIVGDETDAWTVSPNKRLGAVWLLRVSDKEVRALSVICPHLGCGVEESADGKGFACPCHDSAFDLNGNRVAGPSPRGMDPLYCEIAADGTVSVTYVRYRTGVEARQEIG